VSVLAGPASLFSCLRSSFHVAYPLLSRSLQQSLCALPTDHVPAAHAAGASGPAVQAALKGPAGPAVAVATGSTVPPSSSTSSAPPVWTNGPAHAPALASFPPSTAARQRSITPPPAAPAAGPAREIARSSWAGAGAGAGGGRVRGGWADDAGSLDLSAASAPSLAAAASVFSSAVSSSPARAPDVRAGRAEPSRPDSRLEQLEVQLAAVEMGDSLRGRTRSSDQDAVRSGPGFDVPSMVGRAVGGGSGGGSKLMRM
jgi:hypothetical protein